MKIKVGLCWVSGGRWEREMSPDGRGFAEIEFRCLRLVGGEKDTMAGSHSLCCKEVTHECGRLLGATGF